MKIFQEKERPDLRWKSYVESDFEYLDRCGRPEAENVRSFMETWFARFPVEHQADLRSRLQSDDAHLFQSASFELVLYACMSSLGYTIEVHPTLPNGRPRHPDFLISSPDGESFYLEAVLASDYDAQEIAAKKRLNVVLQALDGIHSPNFFLGIHPQGNPEKPPPTKKLRGDLQNWLAELDPDGTNPVPDPDGIPELPTFHWEHEGWKIKFEAIPKKPEARGKGQRVIGMLMGGAEWSGSWVAIRDAIKAKGTRYGELNKPMLVAVSANAISVDRIDETQALFGQEQFTFSLKNPNVEPKLSRAENGAWYGPQGPQFTRVSGVWIFRSMDCWHVGMGQPTLYFNPHAAKPLPEALSALKHADVQGGYVKWHDGKVPRDILALPEGWPETSG